jgi:hypothetical protein
MVSVSSSDFMYAAASVGTPASSAVISFGSFVGFDIFSIT